MAINDKIAEKNYLALIDAVKAIGWTCNRHDSALKIDYDVKGNNLKMSFRIFISADRQLVVLRSDLPFKFPINMLAAGATLMSTANYAITDGCFDYNIENGSICFRMTESYRGCPLNQEAFKHLISYSVWVIDEFSKPFMEFINGKLSQRDALEQIENL